MVKKGFAICNISPFCSWQHKCCIKNIENEFDFHSEFLPKYSIKKTRQNREIRRQFRVPCGPTCAADADFDAFLRAPKHTIAIAHPFFGVPLFTFCNAISEGIIVNHIHSGDDDDDNRRQATLSNTHTTPMSIPWKVFVGEKQCKTDRMVCHMKMVCG